MRQTLTVFLVLFIAFVGCDILNPASTKLENQLQYVNTGRSYIQAMNRWWPWLAPENTLTTPALGNLPFAIPATFPAEISSLADFGSTTPTPSSFFCSLTCSIEWVNDAVTPSYFIRVSTSTNGHVTSGKAEIDAGALGTWNINLGLGAQITSVVLSDNSLHPVNHWQYLPSSNEGPIATFGLRKGLDGRLLLDDSDIMAVIDPMPWANVFLWPARPVQAEISYGTRWHKSVQYQNGISTFSATDLESGQWSIKGPGISSTAYQIINDTWTTNISYLPEQALQQVTTTISRTPATGILEAISIVEERITRLGTRNRIVVQGQIEDGKLRLRWQENDVLSGTVDIFPDVLGWRIEAFWDTVFGDLIEANIDVYFLGIWAGSLTGWAPDDTAQASENGEWIMLPDGSFQSDLLFKQVDGSVVTIPVISPPEGTSRTAME